MTSSTRSVASASLVALMLALSGRARAEANLEAAKVAVDVAQKAYDLGRFEDAAIAYRSALELSGLPALLFNLAQCHRQLKQYERAAHFYERYLAEEPPPIENETVARGLLEEMKAQAANEASVQLEPALALAPVPFLLEAPSLPAEALPGTPKAAAQEEARAEPETPLVKQWWLWTIVGAVVTGGAVAVGVLATQGHPAPSTSLGEIHF